MDNNIRLRDQLPFVGLLKDGVDYANSLMESAGYEKRFKLVIKKSTETYNVKEELKTDPDDKIMKALDAKGLETYSAPIVKLSLMSVFRGVEIEVIAFRFRIQKKSEMENYNKQQIELATGFIKEAIVSFIFVQDHQVEKLRREAVETGLVGADGKAIKRSGDVLGELEQRRREDIYNAVVMGCTVMLNEDDPSLGKAGTILTPTKYNIQNDVFIFDKLGLPGSKVTLVAKEG